MLWKASLAAAFFLLSILRAQAWGPEGHEIVAHIAARELSPRARAEIASLLGGNAEAMMVAQANWADEIRDARPATSRWHFVNIPLGAAGFDRRRDCAGGNCVVARMEADLRILADRKRPRAVRAEALRFLIHFAGDIHQPLHTIDNDDRGGNDIRVRLGRGRNPASLHQVWDTRIVTALPGHDAGLLAGQVAAAFPAGARQSWRNGAPADWANESFRLAQREIYAGLEKARPGGPPLLLPRDYAERKEAVIRAQLARAGARLGWQLNTALK